MALFVTLGGNLGLINLGRVIFVPLGIMGDWEFFGEKKEDYGDGF